MDDGFGNLTEKRYANREGLPSSYAGGSYLADGVPPPTRGRPVDTSNYPQFMPPSGFPHGGSIYTTGSAMAASVNFNSKYSTVKKVNLSYTEAESKRLVLAFESRTQSEIIWALNTLAIFSCNTVSQFTLDNQPYLLESISNYMIFCIQNIETLGYRDPYERKSKSTTVTVPSYVDTAQVKDKDDSISFVSKIDYKNYGSFNKDTRKRDAKADDKKKEEEKGISLSTGPK